MRHLKTILRVATFTILSPIFLIGLAIECKLLRKREVPHLIALLIILSLVVSSLGNTDVKERVELPSFMRAPRAFANLDSYYKTEYNSKGEVHPPLKLSSDLYTFVESHCNEKTISIYPDIILMAKNASLKPEILFAIAWADTQCGKHMSTPNNYGNVGNNDRGDRRGYFTALEGWEAIAKTLNNKYIGGIQRVGHLSQGGRIKGGSIYDCANAPAPYKCYATSIENWNNNALRALRVIKEDEGIDESFVFRTEGEKEIMPDNDTPCI